MLGSDGEGWRGVGSASTTSTTAESVIRDSDFSSSVSHVAWCGVGFHHFHHRRNHAPPPPSNPANSTLPIRSHPSPRPRLTPAPATLLPRPPSPSRVIRDSDRITARTAAEGQGDGGRGPVGGRAAGRVRGPHAQ